VTGNETDVLVIGAGTTGLTAALQAHACGARVRIVERRSQLTRPSRAMMIHPRTLEELFPLGVTDELLASGDASPRAEVHLGSRVISADLDRFGLRGTSFPRLLFIRQTHVEAVLAGALAARGLEVEFGVELVDLKRHGEGVVAILRHDDVADEVFCRYVAACDGPASTARGILGIPWRGGTYDREVILADLELARGPTEGVAHVVIGRRGLLFLFAIGESAPWRMLATRRTDSSDDLPFGQPGPPVSADVLQRMVDEAGLPARIARVAWSARVPLQHRIASRFRVGPVFLAGDAAHSHSPAGGQGMNAGIQDAVNLGWKLAFAARAAIRGGDAETLLDSYERERRPVDRRIRALTHLLFWAESGTGPLPTFGRGVLAPLAAPAVPALLRRRRIPAAALRLLSQLSVRYRRSPLSVDGAAGISRALRAGRRLPDGLVLCRGHRTRLQQVIARPGIHLLLQRDAGDPDHRSLGPGVYVHRITNWAGRGMIGVRPDGYIGFRSGVVDDERLHQWLTLVAAV
jgi:2-polyprenyl-6-methoxyphenol hydroxylase-like FAD-dependent oxidoreductase